MVAPKKSEELPNPLFATIAEAWNHYLLVSTSDDPPVPISPAAIADFYAGAYAAIQAILATPGPAQAFARIDALVTELNDFFAFYETMPSLSMPAEPPEFSSHNLVQGLFAAAYNEIYHRRASQPLYVAVGDCLTAIAERNQYQPLVERARELYENGRDLDGNTERQVQIDDATLVSLADEHAFVQAWVYVKYPDGFLDAEDENG